MSVTITENLNIRQACEKDAEAISKIYNWYVLNSAITFETTPVDASDMKQRINEKLAKHDWIVSELNREICGYAYYGSFRAACSLQSYRGIDQISPLKKRARGLERLYTKC